MVNMQHSTHTHLHLLTHTSIISPLKPLPSLSSYIACAANVHIPKDRVTQLQQGFGFVEFKTEEDADYALRVMNMVKVYGKPLRINKSASDKREDSVGANLFIGNLDPEVDEKMLCKLDVGVHVRVWGRVKAAKRSVVVGI